MISQPEKTVFLDFDTVSTGDLDLTSLRGACGEVTLFGTDAALTAQRIRDAEVVLLNKLEIDRAHLSGASKLRLIALAATGTNNIDLIAARELGIGVCNVPAYCTDSVVQHVWALILSLTQHVREYSRLSTDGSWTRGESSAVLSHPIRELKGRVFGVVGWGELGRGSARIAEAFGMRVLVAARPGSEPQAGRVPLDSLLREADIVSLHCPLTAANQGLIGGRELALMKRDALLINTARGALIDGAALAAALKEGLIAGAGIDVLPEEPPAADEPLIEAGVPNLLVTPHIAWAAREARQRCIDEMAANVREFYGGGRRNRVD